MHTVLVFIGLLWSPGIHMCMRPANERRRYNVKPSLIDRAHTHNDPRFVADTCELFIHDIQGDVKWKTWIPKLLTSNALLLLDIHAGKTPVTEHWLRNRVNRLS